MTGLPTRLPLAFLPPSSLSRFAGQSIGGRWLGGIRGVPFAQRELTLQILNLLFGIRDLFLGVRDLSLLLSDLLRLLLNLSLFIG